MNDRINIGICKIVEHAVLPVRATQSAACFDVSACFHEDVVRINGDKKIAVVDHGGGRQVTLFTGDRMLVPTGLIHTIPAGYKLAVYPRSGMAFKSGVTVINSPGTVDEDYNRELFILLVNHSGMPVIIKNGDRIAQIEFVPVVTDHVNFIVRSMEEVMQFRKQVEESVLARTGGIGHTGK